VKAVLITCEDAGSNPVKTDHLKQKNTDKSMNYTSDPQFEFHVLSKVLPYFEGGGWNLSFDNGWSIACTDENCKIAPKVGETVKLFGAGVGSAVRGIVIDERLYRYQTVDQEAEAHSQWLAEYDRVQKEDWEKNKIDILARLELLPDLFRERLKGFMAKDPKFASAAMGLAYELFASEQAVEIAKHLDSVGAVEAFRGENCESQKLLVPTLDEGHSGCTFGMAVSLAKHYLTQQGKL